MKTLPYQQIGELFEAVGSPIRIQILLAIGTGDLRYVHKIQILKIKNLLESMLGLRQAYISQQLMDLREKGVIASRREGKFIYHRLAKPEFLDLVHVAARAISIPEDDLSVPTQAICECPKCKQQG